MIRIFQTNNSIFKISIRLIVGIILGFTNLVIVQHSAAQGVEENWSTPVNLSQSGAASQPSIVSSPDGIAQAFWWDRFDGLITAYFDGVTWSDPLPAPIRSESLETTPNIVVNANGWLYAFWLEPDLEIQNESNLLYSQMLLGSTEWTSPTTIAQSAVDFDISLSASGGVNLAYIRTLHIADEPAGVYFKKNPGNGSAWNQSIPIYTNNYFRLLSPELAHVRLAASETNELIYLVWEEPASDGSQFVISLDGGSSWATTTDQIIGSEQDPASYPRVAALPEDQGALLLWESEQGSGCTIFQRHLDFSNLPDQSSFDEFLDADPKRVIEGLFSCPRNDRLSPISDGTLWLWDQGTDELSMSAWQSDPGDWTIPLRLGFNFEDDETGKSVNLDELQTSIDEDQLIVIGTDQNTGEVWATMSQTSALDMLYAPPPLWTSPLRLSQESLINGLPVLIIDQNGIENVIWSESAGRSESLFYTRAFQNNSTRPVAITQASQGRLARQPNLVVEKLPDNFDLLHLVWSGGDEGQIFYSHTLASNAYTGGWVIPKPLSNEESASWPQIERDSSGRLYVVYVVPLNEGRGVYFVYSDDNGENWSDPIQVFDGAEAGFDMVNHPALAIATDGSVHVAWVETPLPGMGVPENIFYSRSDDGGNTWSKPFLIIGSDYDWPHLSVIDGQLNIIFLNPVTGGVYHRWSSINPENEAASWSTIAGVPGCQDTYAPFGLAATSNELHLVCTSSTSNDLSYSIWNVSDNGGGRWSSPETVSPQAYGITQLQEDFPTDQGASVAAQVQQGELAVAWLTSTILEADVQTSQRNTQSAKPLAIFLSNRDIPIDTSPPTPSSPSTNPTITPVETPFVTVTPQESATIIPTPTPDLSDVPLPSGNSIDPQIMGIGITVIIVGCLFGGWIIWRRGKLRGRQ